MDTTENLALFILKVGSLYSFIYIKGCTALCSTSKLYKYSDAGSSTDFLLIFCIVGESH